MAKSAPQDLRTQLVILCGICRQACGGSCAAEALRLAREAAAAQAAERQARENG